jgi:hypothetical protein
MQICASSAFVFIFVFEDNTKSFIAIPFYLQSVSVLPGHAVT